MFVWDLEREWKCGSIILHGPQVSEVKNAMAIFDEDMSELNSVVVVGSLTLVCDWGAERCEG